MSVMVCDDSAQVVWGAQALTAVYADCSVVNFTTARLDTRTATSVLWTFGVTNLGVAATRIDLRFFYTSDATITPASVWIQSVWTTTIVVAGTAQTAVDPREYLFDVTGAVVPFKRGIATPGLGRWMKVQARAGVGNPVGSSMTISATRYYVPIVDPGPM